MNGEAFPEVAPLAFTTMWHEHETHYPPLGASDWWNPEMYTADSRLVRMYPRLVKHAASLCDGALKVASVALKLP